MIVGKIAGGWMPEIGCLKSDRGVRGADCYREVDVVLFCFVKLALLISETLGRNLAPAVKSMVRNNF